jgi:hypothetical protein
VAKASITKMVGKVDSLGQPKLRTQRRLIGSGLPLNVILHGKLAHRMLPANFVTILKSAIEREIVKRRRFAIIQ